MINGIESKLNQYDINGIKWVILKVIELEFPDLAATIKTTTHLDNTENIVTIGKTFCNFDSE